MRIDRAGIGGDVAQLVEIQGPQRDGEAVQSFPRNRLEITVRSVPHHRWQAS